MRKLHHVAPTHDTRHHARLGWLYCALAMVTVGSTVVASKLIAASMAPFLATALRHALALPLFALLWWWQRRALPALRPMLVRMDQHDRWLLLAQAAAGSVGYGVLLLWGLRQSSAADAGVIVGTLPAVAGLFAVVVLRERPGLALLAALGLATLGVLAVSLGPDGFGAGPVSGLVLLLGAVSCEAVFILLNKRLHQPLPAVPLSTLMSAGGVLLAGAAALVEHRFGRPPGWSAPALLGVLYYALVPTFGGFLLWYAGSARLAASQAALTTALLPAAALLLSALVLGETIRPAQWAGLGCVLLSILVGAAGGRAAPEPAEVAADTVTEHTGTPEPAEPAQT